MKPGRDRQPIGCSLQRLGRTAALLACALCLCSCRGPEPSGARGGFPAHAPPALPCPAANAPGAFSSVPGQAYTGVPATYAGLPMGPVAIGPDGTMAPAPMPYDPIGPWAPPGIAQPWPKEEYLADGGDTELSVQVGAHRQVHGLDMEDTVAHFDTLDGRTLVEPSNQVHIYSPRFRAVRQVVGLQSSDQHDRSAGVHVPAKLVRHDEVQRALSGKQHVQPNRDVGARSLTIYRTEQFRDVISTALGPRGFQDAFLPYENLAAIRLGVFQEAEMAQLAKGTNAAIAWSHKQAVQVILDQKKAAEEISGERVGSVYVVKEPPGHPKLRIIKVASTHFAEPGDTIDFTLRFDNVGDQVIGNVTILDNLSPRLDYVAQSAQCNLPARFLPQPNEAGSTVLRWEIANPLNPGQGGIIRLKCVVR